MHFYFPIKSLLFIITLTLLSSCKSQHYTFENYKGSRIAIGSSGGFTGATIKYYIFENGQLFRSGQTGHIELPSIDKKIVKQQFNNYQRLGFDKMEINDSGNMSYFIIMNPDSDNAQMLKWGGGSVQPSKELEQYYKLLSDIIKNSTKSKSDEHKEDYPVKL